MAGWSDVGASYAEAVQGLFPLHRACIFMLGLLASLAIEVNGLDSVVQTLFAISILDFLSISSGFLGKATLLNFFFGCLAVVVAWVVSAAITRCFYFLIDKSTNFVSRAIALDRSWTIGLNVEDRRKSIDLIDDSLSDVKVRIQNLSGFGELVAGIFSILVASSMYTGLADLGLSLIFLLISVLLHGMKMHIFFRDFFGPTLTRSHLQGKVLPKI